MINDKYISKLILLFFYHGPPSLLINLDLNEKYCDFTKRLKFLKRDLTPQQMSELSPEKIEFLFKQKSAFILSESQIGSFKSILRLKSIIQANNDSFNFTVANTDLDNETNLNLEPRHLPLFMQQISENEGDNNYSS